MGNQPASPLDKISKTLQDVWKHVGPHAGPVMQQAQQLMKPLMDNLPPAVTDVLAKASKELHGHDPLAIIVTSVVGTLLLLRLLGVLKKFTTILMLGLAGAYLWPYAEKHLLKK